MSKKKVVILKNKPLPKTKLIDLSKIKDWKNEEIVRHANKGLAVCMADGKVAGYALVVWNLDGTLGRGCRGFRGWWEDH